jgi:hypothetical protein
MYKVLSLAAVAALSVCLAACGGGDSPSTLDSGATSSSSGGSSSGGSSSGSSSGGTTKTTYSMGNGVGSSFQSGMIGLASTSLAAGATTSVTLDIVDQTGTLYTNTSPVTVTFSSQCLSNGLAVLAANGTTGVTIATTTGTINGTYTAKGCSGADVITATATLGSQTLTATGTVTVSAASVGSIQFVSATPTTIGLKGTGLNETSTLVFKVVDSTGGARPGVNVTFALSSSVGGLTLSPPSATSANDGTVQTVVSSGTQHTTVTVQATTAATGSSPSFSTESSQLTVTTGLPASAAFSIAVGAPSYASSGPACANVEAYDLDLITVPVTVQLADRYGNPAPDGTPVAFTADGGHIVGSCSTPLQTPGDGECKVTWTSANPRPAPTSAPPSFRNGRAMILATAGGEESFDDLNGNGYWDPGEPFTNLGEPYRDDNENGQYDLGEYFLDFDKNGAWTPPPNPAGNNFKGITCSGGTCTDTPWAIGVSHLIIMSTGGAQVLSNPGSLTLTHGTPAGTSAPISIAIEDLNGNPMAAGTTVAITASASVGTLSGQTSWTVGCRGPEGGAGGLPGYASDTTALTLTAGTTAGSGSITVTVTSPGSKAITTIGIPVTVN